MSLMEEFKQLNKTCQKPDYKKIGNWYVRNIIRDSCVPATYFLLKTPITANQITLLSLVLGILGCVMFLIVPKAYFVYLAFFLQLSYYFDHVDGQIARSKKQVSLSGIVLDIISHYIIFASIIAALTLKAFSGSHYAAYLYLGMIGVISIISFNLLVDSKYRAFFIELQKYSRVEIITGGGHDSVREKSVFKSFFALLHKTCEMHVIINTLSIIAVIQLFGLDGISIFNVTVNWPQLLTIYYSVASFVLAAVKTFFFMITKKPDNEFSAIFSVIDKEH